MISDRNAAILRQELSDPVYDGMTAKQAWEWLFAPYVVSSETVVVAPAQRLTPRVVASLIGPAKANAIAQALKSTFPAIGDVLMAEGVDPAHADTVAFLGQLKTAGTLSQADLDKLTASTTRTNEKREVRAQERFLAEKIIALAVAAGLSAHPPADEFGFPNLVDLADFQAAWSMVRP